MESSVSVWVRQVPGGWKLMVGVHDPSGAYTEAESGGVLESDEDALAMLKIVGVLKKVPGGQRPGG